MATKIGESNRKGERKRPARRYRRRTVRIEVEYQSPQDAAVREYATTLGAGGLFIESEKPLPRTTRIKLAFTLPGRSHRHEIEGRVIWATPPAEPDEEPRTLGSAGMGIQFTDRVGETLLARELEDWEAAAQS